MNKIIFHIGYPRTGTTYLQEKIFPKINSINFIGKPFKSINSKIFYNFEKKIFSYDEIFFNENIKNIANELKPLFKNKINLISHEGFLRNTRFFEKKHKFYKGNNYSLNLRRIYQVLSLLIKKKDIFFLIFIRKQEDILPSYYSNFWKSELELHPKIDFLKFINNCLDTKRYNFSKALNYNKLFNFLSNFIPKKNIIFLNYESFFEKEKNTIKKFSSLFGLRENEIKNLISSKIINSNKINRYYNFRNMDNYFPKILRKRFYYNPETQEKIFNFYKSDNKKLDRKIKFLNLKSKKYY
tara:strand:- start:147 stop:1037 length:891 start_codon:yes stop_codon:yes gene_type:complete